MKKSLLYLLVLLLFSSASTHVLAEDGYRLWLRYEQVQDAQTLHTYRQAIQELVIQGNSPTLTIAQEELQNGLSGLLGQRVQAIQKPTRQNILLAGTPAGSALIAKLNLTEKLKAAGEEGYLLLTASLGGSKYTVIAANTDIGVLYGSFHLLRLMQTQQNISNLSAMSTPKLQHRVLNHWDNLDRTVERGYAGFSLWDWHRLPGFIDQRYLDYARANASIGINGTVLTNVNANALILTPTYLKKVAALADAFRPYGIKVYLTARFSAPIEIGGLKTADPLDPQVKAW